MCISVTPSTSTSIASKPSASGRSSYLAAFAASAAAAAMIGAVTLFTAARAEETTALYETRKAEEEQELATAEEFMKQYGKTEKRYYFVEEEYKYIFVLTKDNKVYQIIEQNGEEVEKYEFGEFEEVEVTPEILDTIESEILDYSKAIKFYPDPSDDYVVYIVISKDGKTAYLEDAILKAE